ncbi:PBP1A family penicillin-binding protein [Hazenella sp. IB182357]|uniref:PBP1A family penicillin-binding protein n=1 Tax=Polycladospora coralii TaxID=2771432 RepID=A0A926RWZ1_9BACL|nr:PBP1A family penicillin-binding protein [Polycladospora coralii]MBD1372016.1 PBP1A family penicillin-binding protein [Polycladospora coralii]
MREQPPRPSMFALHPIEKIRLVKMTWHLLRLLFFSMLILSLLASIALVFLKIRPLPPPEIHATSMLFGVNGESMGPLDMREQRDPIHLNEVPQHLIKATLAAEDKTFYEHGGFSVTGIMRAVFHNLKSRQALQGASTITQQLARNLYLTHDRTWSRKWKEALYTVQLELHYSKDEILEMYLNKIYYGHGVYGIKRAAQVYFDKPVEKLTIAESAFLVGIPRGPQYYSPYHHLDHAIKRQQHILDLMAENHYISVAEATAAKKYDIVIAPQKPTTGLNAPYFRDYVIQTAVNGYGLDESLVRHGGLKIYTTLHPQLQKVAEESVKQTLPNPSNLQTALLSVDPHTGHIKAMIGGKSYPDSQYNRIFAKRQPGSTFKPFVYLTALQHGFTPLTKIESRPTTFIYKGQEYKPRNYQNLYANRPITMREAIAKSDNIYAVRTQFQVGIPSVIETAKRLGIQSDIRATPSVALGSYTVSPYELTQAYATLANGGIHRPLTGILKIVDSQGNVLVEEKSVAKRVIPTAPTFVLTQMLRGVLDSGGTGRRAGQIFQYPAAAKTGTTDYDGWLAAYTPQLATTVWVGYDQGEKIAHRETRLAQFIWGRYMNQSTTIVKPSSFQVPAGVTSKYIDPTSHHVATNQCPSSQLEYFVEGTEPTQLCPLHPEPEKLPIDLPSLWDKFKSWWDRF